VPPRLAREMAALLACRPGPFSVIEPPPRSGTCCPTQPVPASA
jgi:hypothetical protein